MKIHHSIIPALLSLLIPAAFGPARAAAPESTHSDSIFLGMDLHVILEDQEYPLLYFEKGKYVFEKDGEYQALPAPVDINFKKTIRHSDRFARLTDFKSEPYSSEILELINRYSDALAHQANQQTKMDRTMSVQVSQVNSSADVPGALGIGLQESFDQQQANLAKTTADMAADINSFQGAIRDLEERMMAGSHQDHFDALILQLKLRPQETLTHCYLFVRATYTDPNAENPEETKYNIKFVDVGDMEANREHEVRFIMTGFPKGPRITDMSYHLFSGPDEVPTDYSEQRLSLSEKEAYDFLYADLFSGGAHQDADPELFKLLPFQLAREHLREETLARAELSLLIQADGEFRPLEIRNCPEEELPAVREILAKARFLPAVEDGLPVDRRVSFPLNSIFRDLP